MPPTERRQRQMKPVTIPQLEHVEARAFSRRQHRWMLTSDGRLFVFKGQSGHGPLPPSAREAYCALLCRAVGLSTPNVAAIDPRPLRASGEPVAMASDAKLLFGSEVAYRSGSLFDYLPTSYIKTLDNLDEVISWPLFDLWVGNAKPTQAIFIRKSNSVHALKIDHSACFNWEVRTYGSRPAFIAACEAARGSGGPPVAVLTRIKELAGEEGLLTEIARTIPVEFGADLNSWKVVVRQLADRAAQIDSPTKLAIA